MPGFCIHVATFLLTPHSYSPGVSAPLLQSQGWQECDSEQECEVEEGTGSLR